MHRIWNDMVYILFSHIPDVPCNPSARYTTKITDKYVIRKVRTKGTGACVCVFLAIVVVEEEEESSFLLSLCHNVMFLAGTFGTLPSMLCSTTEGGSKSDHDKVVTLLLAASCCLLFVVSDTTPTNFLSTTDSVVVVVVWLKECLSPPPPRMSTSVGSTKLTGTCTMVVSQCAPKTTLHTTDRFRYRLFLLMVVMAPFDSRANNTQSPKSQAEHNKNKSRTIRNQGTTATSLRLRAPKP